MKFCIYILKATFVVLLVSLGLYIGGYCIGKDGPDPVDMETIGISVYIGLGLIFSIILIRRSGNMRMIWFGVAFVAYLLIWTFPAIITTLYMALMLTAG